MSKVVYDGWMVRYGRRKIGRSFIHMRYFVLETRVLAYYKRKPRDNMVPIKSLFIDGNCRVEDRGLKIHHGHMVYVLCIYNKKDKYHQITMAAFNIQEALIWREKIESVIDQQQDLNAANGSMIYSSFLAKSGIDVERNVSSSEQGSPISGEDDDKSNRTLIRRMTIGNGPPESVLDWTQQGDSVLTNQSTSDQVFSRKYWRLVRCQNGLRIFEELSDTDYLPRSCSRAMKAVGVVEATCEAIFELVMSMDGTRFEWDCSFQYGSLVEEVDGHTAILYHRLQLDWFPMLIWPRDLCYLRYWRRNDDGSYVVLIRSREHPNCSAQPGFVRAHVESGGFTISPLKPLNGRPRTQVQHLMQIDLKGWGVSYLPTFQQRCLLQMLNSVAGLRDWFSQTDGLHIIPRIPVLLSISPGSFSSKKARRSQEHSNHSVTSQDQLHSASEHSVLLDEESDEDEDYQIPDTEEEVYSKIENVVKHADEHPLCKIDLSIFSGNLQYNDQVNSRDCWRIPDGNNFKVRSKTFCTDKTKIPAGKPLMELVAVDWFKDVKRIDHVTRREICAARVASEKGLFSLVINVQVPGSTHYSMVFYFVSSVLRSGSLLQHFVDGDDEFRNSRFKLIPSVPKGSWIVRQSVGSTPCLLGKAVDCTYIRGPKYLEIDVDIGSSTVANGVLGLVFGVITTLVVDMAFLIQANTYDELPEQLIGAVRVSHLQLSSAMVPLLEPQL
ncbi:hypothetical protein HPP92_025340 [Vanilla planifolia]|uniref:APOSTART n=1 Tax=Vanilla planifolia TaxID=51239 RepID=A0A835PKT0_VANPL|nr:hypothetical protein HPP92_025610 [Vanilla planifolia]KAG0454036.1 hypothetical protein HPP92_025340 [Vanilla planifolia]